jgi:hypothetical protein
VNAGDVIQRFENLRRTRRGWSARCPAHDDRANSLSVAIGDDGRVLVNCFAQCRPESVVHALGLELRDLFQGVRAVRSPSRRRETLSPLDQARREILLDARRQRRRLEPYLEAFDQADSIRLGHQVVAQARRVATAIGERDDVWELLAGAAWLETATWAAEAAA